MISKARQLKVINPAAVTTERGRLSRVRHIY
jgi:hypothetical protein